MGAGRKPASELPHVADYKVAKGLRKLRNPGAESRALEWCILLSDPWGGFLFFLY